MSQLASEHPATQSEYLIGEEPQWSDILTGRAIERSHDLDLLTLATEILDGKRAATAIALTGTAGTGKSTALMSLGLRLSGAGVPVHWIDKDSAIPLSRVREKLRHSTGKLVLAVDDADLWGRDLTILLRDLVPRNSNFLLVFAVRSGKLDELVSSIPESAGVTVCEHEVPSLTDGDIDKLIAVLDKNNRLGILKGATPEGRRKAFRDQAGRQMLVAMIQATSNENFERKAHEELTQLRDTARYVYSLICVATSLRHYVTRDEIVLASAENGDEALGVLERLTARHVISTMPPHRYRARHRVIADLVFNKLGELRELKDVFVGLTWALATKLSPSATRDDRTRKFLSAAMNHSLLRQLMGFMDARDVFGALEGVLNWFYHYWLQRGSLEVEAGDIRLAENFLGAAYSMAPEDFRVQTAYAYMLMRKAHESPNELGAVSSLGKGRDMLKDVINNWGTVSAYPFHVLGVQGLAWANRGPLTRDERRVLLRDLWETVEQGHRLHPTSTELARLKGELQREYLLTVTIERPPTASLHK